ncbi:sigma D regulator [Thalassotalea aquiviva]|uniref:sigma D regulator n=1 Tax=Thalassotalea aquiviva TaxID=3242415 RepID=UPI00352B781E
MLNRLEKTQQLWGGSNAAIDAWLAERQDVLVKYCELAGLPPFDGSDALPDNTKIQSFCQLLMDYLSAGHFEVFDHIVSKCEEKGPKSMAIANEVYPKIAKTTDIALSFNDRFAELKEDADLNDFDLNLSALGQLLEERFELEDQLIETLYLHHSPEKA